MAGPADRIDRLSVEFTANDAPLIASIRRITDAVRNSMDEQTAAAKKFVTSTMNQIYAADRLEKQIRQMVAGGANESEIIVGMATKLQRVSDQYQKLGQPLPELVDKFNKLRVSALGSEATLQSIGQTLQQLATSPIQALQSGLMGLVSGFGTSAAGAAGLLAGIGALGIGVGKLAENLSDSAVELRNQAIAAGMTTQQYQALKRVGVETGVGLESLPRMLGMLNRELGTGTKMDFVKVLNALRLEAGEGAADISHGVIPVLDDLGKRLAAIEEPGRRAELMNAAFNRRLQELGALIILTKGHLQDYIDKLVQMGVTYTPETQRGLENMKVQLSAIGETWIEAKNRMTEYFVAAIENLSRWAGVSAALAPGGGGPGIGKGVEDWFLNIPENVRANFGALIMGRAPRIKPPAAPEEEPFVGPPDTTAIDAANRKQKEGLELAKLLHAGMKDNLDLLIKLAEAEEKYNEAVNAGVYTDAQARAREYAALKDLLDLEKRFKEFQEGKGGGVISRVEQEMGAGWWSKQFAQFSKEQADQITSQMLDYYKMRQQAESDYESIERSLSRDMTQGALNQLKLEQQITQTIIPRTEYEREAVEEYKAYQEEAIRTEEIRLKYAQKRREEEFRINILAKIPIPYAQELAAKAREDLAQLDQYEQEEYGQAISLYTAQVLHSHADAYKRMIDIYKEQAGYLFYAILDSGKKGFEAILDWLKNTFAALLRTIFENVIANVLQNTGIYQAIRKTLAQTYPSGGPQTGIDLFGGMTKAVEQGTSAALQQAIAPSYAWNAPAEEWQPENYVMAPEYVGGYSGGAGTLSIPSIYQMGAGIGGIGTAAKAGGGGWLSGLFGGSAGMASSLALGVPSASILGLMSNNAYVKGLAGVGLGVTALTGIGTAMVGGGMSTFTTALAANLTNPITAVIAGAVLGGIALYKAARGPSTEKAGSEELARDLGIGVGKDTVKNFISAFMSPEQAWGIRKDILSSPQFLTQVGGKAAKAQGEETYQKFLKDLEQVKTAWGTFDFRQAFEIGDLTGDWSQLDKAFTDAFEHSTELQKVLPNWRDVLLVTGDAAKKAAQEFEGLWTTFQTTGEMTQEFVDFLDQTMASLDAAAKLSGAFADQLDKARASAAKFTEMKPIIEAFQGLKDSLPGAITETKTIYQTFLDTGEILPELRKQIIDFGGDIQAFEKLADIAKVNSQFQTLVEQFKQTGVVTEELRKIVQDFGGDLTVLDKAAELPGLVKGLQGIKDLASGIANLQKTPIQEVLAGEWGPETWGGLAGMGMEPGKLTGITDLTKFEKGWDQAINDLHSKMKFVWDEAQKKYLQVPAGLEKGGLLEQALWKYGGSAGTQAIQNYGAGFNTITEDLLAKTKAAMDEAYRTEIKSTLDYLGQAQEDLQGTIDDMSGSVTEQLDIVGTNIGKAVDAAKTGVITELDKILTAVNQLVSNAGLTPQATPTVMPTGAVKYFNEFGKPYTSESESYWQTGGAWYEGLKGGTVTPIQSPPWLGGGKVVPYLPAPTVPTIPINYPTAEVTLPAPEIPEPYTKYPTSRIPAAETGALVRVHDQEAILNREQTANLLHRDDEPSVVVYIDQRGSTINSDVDMQRSVEKALAGLRARGVSIAFAR